MFLFDMRKTIHSIFSIRDRVKKEEINLKASMYLLSKVYDCWSGIQFKALTKGKQKLIYAYEIVKTNDLHADKLEELPLYKNNIYKNDNIELIEIPIELLTAEPIEITTAEPIEIFTAEPIEILTAEPIEILTAEPIEILTTMPISYSENPYSKFTETFNKNNNFRLVKSYNQVITEGTTELKPDISFREIVLNRDY